MNDFNSNNYKTLPGKKKILFSLISISIPFVLLFLLEILLRVVNYGENYNLFMDFPGEGPQQYRIVNREIGKKYFQKIEFTRPPRDRFLKEKPENGFRVFVMGSSTVIGFPYDENLMFSRILQKRLQDSYPEKHVEVINTALTAINSFTLRDFIDDILKEGPDAILIYAGHNEFYGAMGFGSLENTINSRRLTLLHLELLSFRVYQLLRNIIAKTAELVSGNHTEESVRGTLMKVIAKNRKIPYKNDMYNKAMESYRENISGILKKANRKNVPVFISEVVSNIRDLEPFCSIDDNEGLSANLMFNNAIMSEKEEDFELAKSYYYKAKDLDCIRFRATEEINDIIHEVAGKHNAYLIPMKTGFFEINSPNNLIGNNLLTEHVHPNIAGYFLMADAFFISIADSRIIGEDLNIVYYKNSEYYKRNWGYTEIDSLAGMHWVNNLFYHWPFQPFDAPFIDYRDEYQPTSLADSLAFELIKAESFQIFEAHQVMGDYYVQNGDFYNAFRSYYAATKSNPYLVQNYLKASDCLIKTNDLVLARELLIESLEIQETFTANLRLGEIGIFRGKFEESIRLFKRALQLDDKNEYRGTILTKLLEVYYYNGDNKKFERTLSELKTLNPEYQPRFPAKRTEHVYIIPVQIEYEIQAGINLYKSGNFDAALEILMKTLELKETPIANRIMGDIMMRNNDKDAVIYFLKAYPDYNKNINFLSDLGHLYLRYGATDRSHATLEEIKSIDPENEKIPILEQAILAKQK